MENNLNNNTENNTNETSSTVNTNESSASVSSGRQESGSTYSYSYLNQEQKNPNNIWRADENTAGSYTSAGNTYGSGQTGTGSSYGNTQGSTGSAYSNTQGSVYGNGQSGTYSSSQNGTGVYGSGSQTGSSQNNAYSSSQNNAYGSSQTGAGSAYGQSSTGSTYGSQTNANGAHYNSQTYNSSTQNGTDNAYNNNYGSPDNQQSGWNTYSDAKAQKKEERAKRRAEKKANASSGSNFGIKLAKCASIALVFGLVAGTAFEGSSYVAGSLLGTDKKEAEVSAGQAEEKEVFTIEDSAKKTAPVTADPANTGDGVSAIVEECMPSIVAITNLSQKQLQNWFGQVQSYEVPSAGSGILVSEDEDSLYIATNNHVIEDATTLTIRFCDDTTASAEIKGTDPSMDLAVVQVKKADVNADTLSAIKVATLGDSEKIKVGSQAIAIGNALGYGQSVTVGYISALEREVTTQDESNGKSYTNNLIQTDAAINPGNSGGALLNNSGEVIGINSAKYNDTSVEGMGFAIPSNEAKLVIEDLITRKEVSEENAAYLGIRPEDVTAMIAEAYNMPLGVFVREVFRGTAADQYGIKAGDIITEIDGRDIQSSEVLLQRLSYYEAGTEVEVVVQRPSQNGYEEVKLSVVLGKKDS